MKNNICSECGMPRIDCGNKGIKTINEIALEKKVERLQEQLGEANEVIKRYVDLGNWNDYYNEHLGEVADDMQKYLKKWGVK